MIKGEQAGGIARIVDYRACLLLDEEELIAILKRRQVLEAIGLIKDGKVNVPLLISIIDATLDYEEAKQAVLELVAKRFKTELLELLGGTLPKIELHWDSEFERWLAEKKSKPVTERTLKDYRNIWHTCLEGKVLGWHLLKQLEGNSMLCRDGKYHPTSWARQVFRHYIRFLYAQGKLDWDTYTRLLLVIPGRRYKKKVSQKPILEEDVVKTLQVLKEKRPDIHLVYLLMLYSGVRFEHVVNTIKNLNPDEVLYVEYLKSNIKRLTCLETHCRYYLGKETDIKPAAFMFVPRNLLPLIEGYKGRIPSRHHIYKVAVKKLGVLAPKYIRIFGIRLMDAVIKDNDTYKFILGKFSELTVTGGKYLWLLKKADEEYPKYIKHVEALSGKVK